MPKNIFVVLFMIFALLTACDEESSPFEANERAVDNVDKASSSSVKPGSSEKKKEPIEYGTLTDARDGQTYKTVKIGHQWWMAENLRFAYTQPTSTLDSSSFCRKDSLEYCERYGRLYIWSAVMDSAGLFSDDCIGCGSGKKQGKVNIRGVCPEGWHVPFYEEMKTLINYVGGEETAALVLKSSQQGEWDDMSLGTDDYGFSVLPAGGIDAFKEETRFWLANSDGFEHATALYFMGIRKYTEFGAWYMDMAFSVRCAKDSNPTEAEIRALTGAATMTFVDPRDGKTYKTVPIGKNEWMAENLNYEMEGSYCYDDADSNCTKYGRLYTYYAALEACPQNWALPNHDAWELLVNATSGEIYTSTSGWNNYNGVDYYGLSLIPAGQRTSNSNHYESLGRSAELWSSTQYGGFNRADSNSAVRVSFRVSSERVLDEETKNTTWKDVGIRGSLLLTDTTNAYSVRCYRRLQN